MDWGSPLFVLAIVAIVMTASVLKAALRGSARRHRHHGHGDVDETRRVELLTHENETLKGQMTRLEERLAVLERIATDRRSRLSDEIETLR